MFCAIIVLFFSGNVYCSTKLTSDHLLNNSTTANRELNETLFLNIRRKDDDNSLSNNVQNQLITLVPSTDSTPSNTSSLPTSTSSDSNTYDDILSRFGKNTSFTAADLHLEEEERNSTRSKKSPKESEPEKSKSSPSNSSTPQPVYFNNHQFMSPDYRLAPNGRWVLNYYSSPEYQHPLPGPVVDSNSLIKHYGMPSTAARWSNDKTSVPIALPSKSESLSLKKGHFNAIHSHAAYPYAPIGYGNYPHQSDLFFNQEVPRAIYSCCEIVYGKLYQDKPLAEAIVSKGSTKEEQKIPEASATDAHPIKGERSCFPIYDPYRERYNPFTYRYFRPFPFPFKWLAKASLFG